MKKNIILFILLSITGIFCNSNNSPQEKDYNSQSVDNKKVINGDSLIRGVIKSYYPSGEIRLITNFKKNQKDGWEKAYYKNGSIKYKGINRNGLKDSTWVWYYKNGTIERTVNFMMNENPIGVEINYYNDGSIKEFDFHKVGGTIVYWRIYSPNGEIEEEKGAPVEGAYNRNKFKTGDTLEMITIIGLLPHWKVDFLVTEYQDGKKQHVISHLHEVDFEKISFGNRAITRKGLNRFGNFKWIIDAHFSDKKYGREINYKDTLSFVVKKNSRT